MIQWRSTDIRNVAAAAVLFSGILLPSTASAQARMTAPVVTGNARVDKLLSEMTLAEKIVLVHGDVENPSLYQGEAGYLPGIPRLGIPSLRLADGPPGVLTRVPAMAPTATMGLAATFSREDARQNGEVIGDLDRSHGIDVSLQPFINIDRDVTFRRAYNTFGEDPLLTGQMGAAEIAGIQSRGVMAMAKHYVAFDSTNATNHSTYNVTVPPQALHEIYVTPFADAVNAGVASIMCSYNKVNGKYACGNPDTLITILRDELGFKGFVTSDWGAVHATDFINDGLDMEMPGPVPVAVVRPSYFSDPHDSEAMNLSKAVQTGLVSEATITRAAGRILLQMERFGLLDGRQKHTVTQSDVAADAAVVRKTGEDAAVLLKNEDHVLPLSAKELRSLVLIGPGAGQTIAVGQPGEKSVGLPQREIGTVTTLKKLLPAADAAHVSYEVADDLTGSAIPATNFSHDGQPGLMRHCNGQQQQIDADINFTNSNGKALPENVSCEWTGELTIPSSGKYELHMQILGAYGTLSLDGKRVARTGKMFVHGDITQAGQSSVLPTTDGLDNVNVQEEAGVGPHKLLLSITPDTSNAPIQIRLSWVTPSERERTYGNAIAAAKAATTAIVFVWAQGDPQFQLDGAQNKLVEDVAAVNPNTIVVLNVSQPVALPWLPRVKAVLQMWWPGDEGGWATADVLLGKANPGGRLPFTWARKVEDYPATDPKHPERRGTNADGNGVFSEGIFVGYRWFDKNNIEPLFPFGFGLSYTRFDYSKLSASSGADGGVDVTFTVTNVGSVPGDEVPQAYLGAPDPAPSDVEFAERALVAFDRIHLLPRQWKVVRLHIPARSLEYWSLKSGRWEKIKNRRMLYIGRSSRDLPLHTSVP